MKARILLLLVLSASLLKAQIPTNGLVGYWPFNGNAYDMSGNGNNGTLINGPTLTTDRFGNANKAYNFVGTSYQEIQVPANASLQPAGAVTMAAWVYLTSTSTWATVICKRYDNNNDPYNSYGLGLNTFPTNSKWSGGISNGTVGSLSSAVSSANAPLNQWVFLVSTYDGANVKLYENGVLVATTPKTGNIGYSSLPFRIGGAVNGQNMTGKIDDVRIYNRAISACEVLELYNEGSSYGVSLSASATTISLGEQATLSAAGASSYSWVPSAGLSQVTGPSVVASPTVSTTYTVTGTLSNGCTSIRKVKIIVNNKNMSAGLVAHWPFAGNANDISGNSNHGAVTGAVLAADRFGNANSAYSFNGTSDHISVPASPSTNTSLSDGFTISSWIMLATGGPTNPRILGIQNSANVNYDLWQKTSDGKIYFTNYNGNNPATEISSSSPIATGTWYHVAVTIDAANSSTRVYLNGNLAASSSNAVVKPVNPVTKLGVNVANPWYWKGSLDDIRFYDHALTACEVQELYHEGTAYDVNVSASPSTICSGSTSTLTANGANTFAWASSSTLNQSSGATVTAQPTATTLYTVTGTHADGCTHSKQIEVEVITAPGQPLAVAGNTDICSGTAQTYSIADVAGATSYSWTLPAGWSGTSSSDSITVTAGSAGGNISVAASNACGSGSSQSLAIAVNSAPAQPSSITGSQQVCSGGSENYTTPAVAGATSYTWTLPSGWSGTSTSNSLVAGIGSSGGDITVTANNDCGASSSQTVAITVNTIPASPDTITGELVVCEGAAVAYAVTAVPGATSYSWTLPSGWSGTSTTDTIYATTGAASGIIMASAGNLCGTSTAQSLDVTVNPVPVPTITQNGTELTASTAVSYQWMYNDTAIIGATSQTYTATQNGDYSLSVIDNNGCSGSSAVLQVLDVNVKDVSLNRGVSVYPNPSNGILVVQYAGNSRSVKMLTAIGQEVAVAINRETNQMVIDARSLPAGIYFLVIDNELPVRIAIEK